MISLTNAGGEPVSSFGAGNSQFAQGQQTNPFGLTSGNVFGAQARSGQSNAGFSSNTPSPASIGKAGSSKGFGYDNPAAGAADRMPKPTEGGGAARVSTIPQLNASVPTGIPDTEDEDKEPPQSARLPNFAKGMGEGAPEAAGGEAAAGGGAELADLAVLAL